MDNSTTFRPPLYLVSGCLIGLACRYDGGVKEDPECRHELAGNIYVPVCPEQLGGLPTPREPADLVGGDGAAVLEGRARVVSRSGVDVTANFVAGAEQVLQIARELQVAGVYLKSGSPSCGVGRVLGVTAALLSRAGFGVREF
ncbi:MAG: DUF523 domain-containing protein [Desulfobulbaceae bacterium]|nr:DUF523 domain-containing protein [Desulfobulbaceae bacterium]